MSNIVFLIIFINFCTVLISFEAVIQVSWGLSCDLSGNDLIYDGIRLIFLSL